MYPETGAAKKVIERISHDSLAFATSGSDICLSFLYVKIIMQGSGPKETYIHSSKDSMSMVGRYINEYTDLKESIITITECYQVWNSICSSQVCMNGK